MGFRVWGLRLHEPIEVLLKGVQGGCKGLGFLGDIGV